MKRISVSRRGLVTSAGVVGVGLGSVASAAPATSSPKGPCLDLNDADDLVTILARLHGNIAPGRPRFDWFDGAVSMVSATGDVRALCGIRGYAEARLTPLPGAGRGWNCRRQMFATYTDLETARPAKRLQNPLTGSWVDMAPIRATTDYTISIDTTRATWRLEGPNALLNETLPSPLPGHARTTRTAVLADIQDGGLTAVRDTGTWLAVTSWLPWLKMGQALGHCLIDCRRGGGALSPEELPAHVLDDQAAHPIA